MSQSVSNQDLFKVLCVVCIWGFNFAAIKYTVADVPPIAMTFVRFLITAVLLCFFFRPNIQLIKKMLPISLVMGIGHFGLLYLGASGLDGSTAAILIQLGAPFSVLLAFIVFKEKLALTAGIGISLSFAGAIFLSGEPQGGSLWAIATIIFSAFCWAWANILIKKTEFDHPLSIIFWVSLLSLPGLFFLSFFMETGQIDALINAPFSAWAGLLFTVLASSLFAYYLWYRLLSLYPVNDIVPYSLAVPFIGVASTIVMHGEQLTVYKILGGIMTILGVGLIYYTQKRQQD